jgi:hypothetical protein
MGIEMAATFQKRLDGRSDRYYVGGMLIRNLVSGAGFLLAASTLLFAQPSLNPVPAHVKALNQPDSPVQLTLRGVERTGPRMERLSYVVSNTGTKAVWGLVVGGVDPRNRFSFGAPLQPGWVRHFGEYSTDWNATAEQVISVDLVLFQDGTYWGPDKLGESDYLRGLREGSLAAVAEARKLTSNGDDAELRRFLTREPYLPELARVENKTKSQQGFQRGYGGVVMTLRFDLRGRGDLKGIPHRVAEFEESLGIAEPPKDGRKQISRSYAPGEPVKIEGIYIHDRKLDVDERFPADENWPDGLKFKVRNSSDKRITHLSLRMDFPETLATGAIMAHYLTYGPSPSGRPATPHKQSEVPVPPNEFVELRVDAARPGLRKFIETRQRFDSISRVQIVISAVHFDDGTAWMSGTLMRQKAEDPRQWLPINE